MISCCETGTAQLVRIYLSQGIWVLGVFISLLLFWFGLDKCQVPTRPALSLPLLSWAEERKCDERLQGRHKDRERSLANYCHGQNRLNLGRKGS